ncbi:MAG: dipeptide epimerase [Parvibaculaceae bacterium]|nr:dipeptide epimerase [Parvibaculaceae bacterium]
MRTLEAVPQSWPIEGGFTISRGSKKSAEVVLVTIREDGFAGQGECVPYGRYGETIESVTAQIRSVEREIADGASIAALQALLAPGAARNALDCALWDLAARRSGRSIVELAQLPAPVPLVTAFTLSLGEPDAMEDAARRASARPLLKLKLGGGADLARVEAVRRGAPQARLIVDANEAWSPDEVLPLARELHRLGVTLIEQPLPASGDESLRGLDCPVTLCADESAHGIESLERLRGLYQAINIKLDKTGGFTEALELARLARTRGFQIMAGCMVSTSLAMAPAFYVAQGAAFVDLDGPLLLARDREPGIRYEGSLMHRPPAALWG